MKSPLGIVRIVSLNVIMLCALFALVEGASSLLLIANEIRGTRGLTVRQHSTYDETVGWVFRPNVDLPNMYGPGISLRTNGQRFRADRDYAPEVPSGRTRVICSGDSFTLGYGVSDEQVWCRRLGELDPALETVNLGQGGYGLDQAYLWYKRAGVGLDHQVQLLSFISDDFRRMQDDRFLGYGKPLLGLRGDSIVLLNGPVPRTSAFSRWYATHGRAIRNLSVLRLAGRLVDRDAPGPPADSVAVGDERTRRLAAAIFAELARVNREKHSRLVLVYLPMLTDYRTDRLAAPWRPVVAEEAAKQGIVFVDLIEKIRSVPPTRINDLYRTDSHYSPAGNEWVARELHAALAGILGATAKGGSERAPR